MIYTPSMTTTDLRALVADHYSPEWDLREAGAELARRELNADAVADQPVQGPEPRPWDLEKLLADARDRMVHLVDVSFDGDVAAAREFLGMWEGEVTDPVRRDTLARYMSALDELVTERRLDAATVAAYMDGPRPASVMDDLEDAATVAAYMDGPRPAPVMDDLEDAATVARRRTADEGEDDVEGDRWEDDYWRRGA